MVEEHVKIGCGQYHSCFIGMPEAYNQSRSTRMQRLYVWGQNDEGQLSDAIPSNESTFKKKLDRPQEMRLMYG